MKYIMFEVANNKREFFKKVPVMFAEQLVHRHVAGSIMKDLRVLYPGGVRIVSAGYCRVEVSCAGGSESLNIKSDPHDALIINSYDYAHGI